MKETFIRIAGVGIKLKSEQAPTKETKYQYRYDNFLDGSATGEADIELDLAVVPQYRMFRQEPLFETRRARTEREPEATERLRDRKRDNRLNPETEEYLGPGLDWRISVTDEGLLLEGGSSGRYQLVINEQLTRGKVYIIDVDGEWRMTDIIHGFLQVMLIYYLSKRGEGLLFHACGIQEEGQGYLFTGHSRAGKSTTSRIWSGLGAVNVLNDDRVIVRKGPGGFIMYPTPWHGDHSDYMEGPLREAPLTKMFYIHHGPDNLAEKIPAPEAFGLFYSTLFMPFWDRGCMEGIASFLIEMISAVPGYRMAFKNDERVVSYVKSLT